MSAKTPHPAAPFIIPTTHPTPPSLSAGALQAGLGPITAQRLSCILLLSFNWSSKWVAARPRFGGVPLPDPSPDPVIGHWKWVEAERRISKELANGILGAPGHSFNSPPSRLASFLWREAPHFVLALHYGDVRLFSHVIKGPLLKNCQRCVSLEGFITYLFICLVWWKGQWLVQQWG